VDQPFGGVALGQFGEIEAGGEMIADAMDDDGADRIGNRGEAVLQRQDDAVVQRIALGGTVEPHGQHRANGLDLEQRGITRVGVSHGLLFPLQNSYVL